MSAADHQNTESRRDRRWPFVIVFVVVLLVFLIAVPVVQKLITSDVASWVGAAEIVGALVGALALGALIIQVMLQSKELRLQREELVATREELKMTRAEHTQGRAVQQAQEEAMKAQAQFMEKQVQALEAQRKTMERQARQAELATVLEFRPLLIVKGISVRASKDPTSGGYSLRLNAFVDNCRDDSALNVALSITLKDASGASVALPTLRRREVTRLRAAPPEGRLQRSHIGGWDAGTLFPIENNHPLISLMSLSTARPPPNNWTATSEMSWTNGFGAAFSVATVWRLKLEMKTPARGSADSSPIFELKMENEAAMVYPVRIQLDEAPYATAEDPETRDPIDVTQS